MTKRFSPHKERTIQNVLTFDMFQLLTMFIRPIFMSAKHPESDWLK